jgi:chaperonin GroEL
VVEVAVRGCLAPCVTRSTIQNVASIAGLVLNTETLVVEKPEPKKAMGGGAPGVGGMGDMDY